jgi:hypothetical protein
VTTPKGFDRERLTGKLVGFAKRVNDEVCDPELVEKTQRFAESLTDSDLINFVRMSGIARHTSDHTNGLASGNILFIFDAISRDTATSTLLPLIAHHDIIPRSAAISQLSDAIAIMEARGHDPRTDPVRLRAHLFGVLNFEPLDFSGRLFFKNDPDLVQLVDDRPEDVEAIFTLRNERRMNAITEADLDAFVGISPAIQVGWL